MSRGTLWSAFRGVGHPEGPDDDAWVPGDGAHDSLEEVLGFRPDFIEH